MSVSLGTALFIFMFERLYSSEVVQLLMVFTGVLAMTLMGFHLAEKKWSKYFATWFLAWFLLLPYEGRPIGYIGYNVLSTRLSLELQEVIHDFMKYYKSGPPGFVKNAIFKAASTKITDEEIRKDIHFLIENCVPHGKKKDNQFYSASDLFKGKMSSAPGLGRVFVPSLPSDVLQKLQNKTFEIEQGLANCKSLLLATNLALREHIENKDILKDETLVVGPNNGELPQKRVTTYRASDDYQKKIGRFALNLAQASSIQALILKDYFGKDLDYSGKSTEVTSPLISQIKESRAFYDPTRVITSLLTTPRAIGQAFNIHNFYDNATKLYAINEKLISLPYHIANMQIYLKLFCILAFLALFLGFSKPLILWAIMWFLSLNVPWILTLARLIANALMMHQLKIEEMINELSSDPNTMNLGIDFEASANMLSDSSVLMSSILQFEDGLWKVLFTFIPLAGILGTSQTTSFLSKGAAVISGTLARNVTNLGMTQALTTVQAIPKVLQKVAPRNYFERPTK